MVVARVQERLFQPDKIVIVKDMIVPEEEELKPLVEPPKPFAAKFEQLAPLMEKFKERQAAVADCDSFITDLAQQRTAVERDLSPLERRVETPKAVVVELDAFSGDRFEGFLNVIGGVKNLQRTLSEIEHGCVGHTPQYQTMEDAAARPSAQI